MSKLSPSAQWLADTQVSTVPVPTKQAVHTAKTYDTLAKTLEKLRNFKILSLPVVQDDGLCVGFVDLPDMVAATSELMEKKGAWGAYYSALQSEADFKSMSTQSVMNKSDRDPLYSVTVNTDLRRVVKLMGIHGMHRVLIREGTDVGTEKEIPSTPIGIITQSALVRHLYAEKEKLGAILQKSLTDLNIGNDDVVSVSQEANLVQAFRYMHATKVSAVPILNNNGQLEGVVSVRDMRYMIEGKYTSYISFDALNKTCGDFVKQRVQFFSDTPWNVHQSVTCRADTTLEGALKIFVDSGCHHIFMVDDKLKVVAIVGLADVLKVLMQ